MNSLRSALTAVLTGRPDPMIRAKASCAGACPGDGHYHEKRRLHKIAHTAQKTDYALVSSLERDPLLAERLKNLRTVPGVGSINALNWALEIGDVSRFHSVKQAISYCGLCGDEKSSADKMLRTPLSKQRNKHIQRVLVEAAKLAPKNSHELALVYEKAKQKGNANRATIAVARKMVTYLFAVDRGRRPFVPVESFSTAVA